MSASLFAAVTAVAAVTAMMHGRRARCSAHTAARQALTTISCCSRCCSRCSRCYSRCSRCFSRCSRSGRTLTPTVGSPEASRGRREASRVTRRAKASRVTSLAAGSGGVSRQGAEASRSLTTARDPPALPLLSQTRWRRSKLCRALRDKPRAVVFDPMHVLQGCLKSYQQKK